MTTLADGVSFQAQSAGTGDFVFGTSRSSFLTLAQAVSAGELVNGQVVSYVAQDSLSAPILREWGHGTFNSTGNGSIARTTVLSGNNSPVNFTTPPIVSLTALASDIGGSSPFTNSVVLNGKINNFATYNIFGGTQGPYWINLNLFNMGATTNFTFTATAYPNTFPNATTLNWSFGTPASVLYGYPEIIFGTQGGGSFSGGPPNKPTPKQINALGTLSLTYNLALNLASVDDASLLIEAWAQTTPNVPATNTHEILFYAVATPAVSSFILAYATHFNYAVGGVNVYFALDTGNGAVFMMPVTAANGTTPLKMAQQGKTYTIDFVPLITAALNAGWLTGTDSIGGFEVGFEVRENTGSAIFNKLEWTWNSNTSVWGP
jgi:hypothetical protein